MVTDFDIGVRSAAVANRVEKVSLMIVHGQSRRLLRPGIFDAPVAIRVDFELAAFAHEHTSLRTVKLSPTVHVEWIILGPEAHFKYQLTPLANSAIAWIFEDARRRVGKLLIVLMKVLATDCHRG